ncbi:amidohydrolase [Herbaspirillum sp. RV1423]|uniref:amidohydrolase family protein n=1 Tax=Herbaspirillum sp. RV1423 TaxID=1443993 RepID=UPI0004B650D4|nr:amidohydrolase family protein [Herbaspirillum sp. RV1423]
MQSEHKPGHSPHLAIREDWLALHTEPVLLPDLPIVDAHHHLWDRPTGRYLFDELMADLNVGHNVVATVFVQCRTMYRENGPEALKPVGEVEFINGVAAQSASGLYGAARACAAIVGCADLRLGANVAPVLEALQHAGGGRLRGIRNSTAWHADERIRSNPIQPPPGLLSDAAFRQGAAQLSRFGLSLDIWAYHTQLPEVYALARACPETVIVLNHAGGPLGAGAYAAQRREVFAIWRRDMAALAGLPNVFLKIGGLGMPVGGWDFHLQALPPSSQQLADAWKQYVASCLDLFGVQRCMFESNFPVDKGMFNYLCVWNAFKRLAAGCSPDEQDALFSGNAARLYRIVFPA